MSVVVPDILSPEFAADPYGLYASFREDFPVLLHEPTGAYITSRYEDVSRVLSEPEFSARCYGRFLGAVVGGRVILELEGREHTAHRRLVNPAVHGAGLKRIEGEIEEIERSLLSKFIARGSVDLVREFGDEFPIEVIMRLLALPVADGEQIRRWYTSNVRFASNISGDPDVTAEAMEAGAAFQAYLRERIAERRSSDGDDLLSMLLSADLEGERMPEEEILAFCGLLLTAGGETAGKAFANMVRHLLEHPDQLEAVKADRSLIERAIAETLRFTPPNVILQREPLIDVTLSNGAQIPRDSTIMCLVGAANRDPRHFTDPDSFEINREDLAFRQAFAGGANHVAFGAGRHFCLGAHLARAMLSIGMNLILDNLEDLRFADGWQPVERGIVTRGLESLKLEFTPRAMVR